MGTRITDLGSEEFGQLFTSFQHTAYRLERLPWYGVGYEDDSFRAWRAGRPPVHDPDRDAWTGVIRVARDAGKVFSRVHTIPFGRDLTDYLAYEFGYWYPVNVAAGDDVRIWPEPPGGWPDGLPGFDYWLFDSRDLWLMVYDDDGRFLYAEQVDDSQLIVECNYWRDAALHYSTPFPDYLRNRPQLRAS